MTGKRTFTAIQRYVIFTLHGEKCYLCHRPLDLLNMEVDHIIPETLQDYPETFNTIRTKFGLPASFEVNHYGNWMPSCTPCNRRKTSTVFDPTPMIQLLLQRAAKVAQRAREMEHTALQQRTVSRALNTLERAVYQGVLSAENKETLAALLTTAQPFRVPDRSARPMRLTPSCDIGHRIIHVDDDQRYALCVDSLGKTYRISLAAAIPDLTDRGTQTGIMTLIQNALHVTAVWDHLDGETWYVLSARVRDGAVVELGGHEDRASAIVIAFMRNPENLPNPDISVRRTNCDEGTILELTLRDQPNSPYCFLAEKMPEGNDRHTPLGPTTVEQLMSQDRILHPQEASAHTTRSGSPVDSQ